MPNPNSNTNSRPFSFSRTSLALPWPFPWSYWLPVVVEMETPMETQVPITVRPQQTLPRKVLLMAGTFCLLFTAAFLGKVRFSWRPGKPVGTGSTSCPGCGAILAWKSPLSGIVVPLATLLFLSCAVGPRPAMATNICIRNNALSIDGRVCNLRNKGITSLKPGDFKGLPRLKGIHLNYNKLNSLPSAIFNDLPNLEYIGLGYNNLVELPQDIFKGLNRLEEIDINNNQLVQIPENVFNGLQNLEIITMRQNNLVTLPAGIFKGLKNLRIIDVYNNNLIRLPEGIFKDLENLETIFLGGNYNLTSLPSDIFTGLYPSKIYMNDNKMVCMPDLPQTLSYLHLAPGKNGWENQIDTHGLPPCQ